MSEDFLPASVFERDDELIDEYNFLYFELQKKNGVLDEIRMVLDSWAPFFHEGTDPDLAALFALKAYKALRLATT